MDLKTFKSIIYIKFAFHQFYKCSSKIKIEIICKLVKRVIQFSCFPDRPLPGGDILNFKKGSRLSKRGRGYDLPYELGIYLLKVSNQNTKTSKIY